MPQPPPLASRHCPPCRRGTPPLTPGQLAPYLAQLPHWTVIAGHHLERTFPFPDFATALAFVNRIGEVAEAEGHHPDLHLRWGSVRAVLYTHTIDGLSEADVILAAKIDRLCSS